MQSSVQTLEALKRKITITVPADEVTVAYKARLNEVSKTAKINGFRPGKVPADVIEQRYGKSVLDEIAGKLIQTNFDQAIRDADIRVAGTPSVTDMTINKGEPFEFKATYEVYPEIELNVLENATIEREQTTINDDDMAIMLEKLQKQHADFKVVEREAKDGDRVVIDFDGSIDGEAFEGGMAKQHTLELGSKSMIPGFEEGIAGMKPGEERDVDVKFPDDYQAEELKGKKAVFKIVLHKVEEMELPPVDDKLAEKMQVEGGVDGLKTKVRDGMDRELTEQLKSRLKEQVLDKLLEANKIDVPEVLVAAEVQHLKKMSLNRMASQYGMKPEQLESLNLPDDPYKEQADKRVRLGLLLAEVIKKYDIKSDQDKLKARVTEVAAYYQKPEEVEQWYMSNQEALSEIEAGLIEDQAVEKLLEEATVTDKTVNYQDIVTSQ
ncbi:MAG: trigger factor [Coxiella sp. (in: Bacteria)]|nr:MAG: trigger factor [Coxiella sp. (in: g-proteobacteria)]